MMLLWYTQQSSSRPLYPVGNRNYISQGPSASATDFQQQIRLVRKNGNVPMTNLRLRYWNGAITSANLETNGTNTVNRYASIEYAGTIYPLTYQGSALLTLAPGEWADMIETSGLTIPAGATFYTREWTDGISAGGKVPVMFQTVRIAAGDLYETGNALTNKVNSGTFGTVGSNAYSSGWVLGNAVSGTVLATIGAGDSITAGQGDTSDASGNKGWWERKVSAASYNSINLGRSTVKASPLAIASNWPIRRAMISDIVAEFHCNLGRNDINESSATASGLRTDIQSILTLMQARRCYVSTLSPTTTSTDVWVTTTNQTLDTAAENTERLAYNAFVRAGSIAGAIGYIEPADIWESARDSGIWSITGGAQSADGVHPSVNGHNRASAAVTTLY